MQQQPSRWLRLLLSGALARRIRSLRVRRTAAPRFDLAAGGTALITGASSGIGAAFAHQLAARGYDLILVARRAARLHALADHLQHQYRCHTSVLVADLIDPAQLAQVEQVIQDCPTLSLLINNAGFGTRGTFGTVAAAKHQAMIDLHVAAPTRLIHAALPGLLARCHGAIINVASLSAWLPAAENVTYCATKSYLTMLTEALEFEVRGSGVVVQALCPGYTVTEIHDAADFAAWDRSHIPAHAWMSADAVVAASLAALGHGRVLCVPGWRNRLIILRAFRPRRIVRFWPVPRWWQ